MSVCQAEISDIRMQRAALFHEGVQRLLTFTSNIGTGCGLREMYETVMRAVEKQREQN
jgi:hypothetical protein